MTSDSKTPLDHVHDTLLQLKEMRHYAKNNVELLTTQWLLFDGELSEAQRRAEKFREPHDAAGRVLRRGGNRDRRPGRTPSQLQTRARG